MPPSAVATRVNNDRLSRVRHLPLSSRLLPALLSVLVTMLFVLEIDLADCIGAGRAHHEPGDQPFSRLEQRDIARGTLVEIRQRHKPPMTRGDALLGHDGLGGSQN